MYYKMKRIHKLWAGGIIILMLALMVDQELWAQDKPDQAAMDESNRLGVMLFTYDQAAWVGTDAVMQYLEEDEEIDERVEGYIVEQTEEGWSIGFGRLAIDESAFMVAYESFLDIEYNVLEAVVYDQPEARTGFYRDAMVARNTAIAQFIPTEQVTYNTVVIPAKEGMLYVYLLPAQPEHRVYFLGADFRYIYDIGLNEITDVFQLHKALLTMDLRADPPPLTFSSLVTANVPTETDVFYAISRPPTETGASHYVLTSEWVYILDGSGISAYILTSAFVR
jgi:hypothetical protein